MGYREIIGKIEQYIKNKDYDTAERELLDILNSEEIKSVEDENNMYFTFYNYVEMMIFWKKYQPTKKLVRLENNIADMWYLLGFINFERKNYGKALEYLNKAQEWNPVSAQIRLEKADTYRCMGEFERYRVEAEKAYQYIYTSSYMAKYYRELGFYYSEKRVFDIANALYTQSRKYLDVELVRNELMYIAQQEKREPRFSTQEEIDKLFREYNIPYGIDNNITQMIYNESQRLLNEKKEPELVNFLYRTLYDITLDKNFMLYVNLKDEKTNVVIEIPEIWRVVNKESYSKFGISENTSFLFLTPHNENISVVCDGKCSKEKFEDAYKLNIENMKKNGIIVEAEYTIRGLKNVNQAIIQVQSNENKVRIFQNYLIVNDFLFNIAWQIPNDIPLENIIEVENNSFKGQLIWKLKAEGEEIIKQPNINNMTNTMQQEGNPNKDAISMIAGYNAILEYAKNELKEKGITEDFVKNIERLSRYIIKENNQDPFWSDMARQIFVILITVNLLNNKEFELTDLKEQIKESEKIKDLINGGYEKIDVPELAQFINSVKIVNNPNGNKTFLSVLDTISESLVVLGEDTRAKSNENKNVNNNGNTTKKAENKKEYSQEIKGLPTFKFLFPESMGEYSKFNDNVFELKKEGLQKIRVMISKCSSESNFKKDAKAWIEKNKVDAKMEDVSYRKEKIGDYPIETYELQRIGTTSVRIYKIGYVNNCRITISGRKIGNKEEIINQAFETLTWEDNSEIIREESKVEHKEENKASKAIIVNCPVCQNEFKLNWNVPSSDKVFYCKCPNCNAEIKSENPNYKG